MGKRRTGSFALLPHTRHAFWDKSLKIKQQNLGLNRNPKSRMTFLEREGLGVPMGCPTVRGVRVPAYEMGLSLGHH